MSSAAERKARLEQQIADRRREEEERVQREAAELAELGEWIKEEIRDRNTERDDSERDAEDVAEGMGMEE